MSAQPPRGTQNAESGWHSTTTPRREAPWGRRPGRHIGDAEPAAFYTSHGPRGGCTLHSGSEDCCPSLRPSRGRDLTKHKWNKSARTFNDVCAQTARGWEQGPLGPLGRGGGPPGPEPTGVAGVRPPGRDILWSSCTCPGWRWRWAGRAPRRSPGAPTRSVPIALRSRRGGRLREGPIKGPTGTRNTHTHTNSWKS